MYRKFIGTVAAASLAITAFGAAPARADDEDVARALAALLGIAVVGAIINKSQKDDHVVTRHQPRHVYNPPKPRHVAPRPRNIKPHVQPRPLPDRVNRRLLPGKCLRTFETRRGAVRRGFGNRCLQNNYRFAHRLPAACRITVRSRQGHRTYYKARCLRDQGYRLARR